jgi:hypothetical protein
MALNAEFKQHLHELMVEVADKTRNEEVAHANQLKGRAVATHNSSAFPIAIRDAELHAIENHVGKTIAKYIEAISIWGLTVDDTFERDMISEFRMPTAAPNQLQFPPGINRSSHAQAVNRSYSMELQRLQSRLVREGANRLRELKMKMKMKPQSNHPTIIQGVQYINNGIVGAIGPHSIGTVNVQQHWTAIQSEIDLNALATELGQLKKHLQHSASSSSDFQRLALLSEAEEQAKKRDGRKVMEVLVKVGKGALDAAKDIGTEIAAKVIAKSMGLEP